MQATENRYGQVVHGMMCCGEHWRFVSFAGAFYAMDVAGGLHGPHPGLDAARGWVEAGAAGDRVGVRQVRSGVRRAFKQMHLPLTRAMLKWIMREVTRRA